MAINWINTRNASTLSLKKFKVKTSRPSYRCVQNFLDRRVSSSAVVSSVPTSKKFKMPLLCGISLRTVYKLQLEFLAKADAYDKEQTKTALILGLWDQVLTMLEVLDGEMSYCHLMETLESQYVDSNLDRTHILSTAKGQKPVLK